MNRGVRVRVAAALVAAAVAAAALGAAPAAAWGSAGHRVTASIAQGLLGDAAGEAAKGLLGGRTLESVATWADDMRLHNASWAWSTELHYANTPSWACNFVAPRDCAGGRCVVGAIANYTARLGDGALPEEQRREALYMLVHLVGDVHQPLHVSFASDHGGNLLKGTFFGAATNLHSVWDEGVVNRRVRLDFGGDRSLFEASLAERVAGGGTWHAAAAGWAACAAASGECATAWGNESARYTCARAETDPDGARVGGNFTLGEPYYARALPLVEQRLAQGGVRLAGVLNAVLGQS